MFKGKPIEVYGANGVYAKVVQHSCDENNPENEILTVNVKYGLIIHAEFLRHRQLSRGVKSNRAIPTARIRKEVLSDPYVPVWFGAAQKGMVADGEVASKWLARQVWLKSRYLACGAHYIADKVVGGHKEWVNRLLNPWQFVRETITATEWDNLYNLRLHKDAQKDIKGVVDCIYKSHKESVPVKLKSGEWHVPYIDRQRIDGVMHYSAELSAEDAIKCSAARCARSSYDNHDGTTAALESDLQLYNTLIESAPAHASPVEHQATPMRITEGAPNWTLGRLFEESSGITHIDSKFKFWSGNFKGFIQYRQTLKNHTCINYKGD